MKDKIIFLLVPLSLIFDILTDTVFESGGILAIIKAFLFYSVILYALFYGYKRKKNVNGVFVVFFIYVFLQIPFSNEPIESLRISLKVLMSILMFPVGYYFISSNWKFKILNRSIVISMFIYIANYIVSQYFGIGVADYTKGKDFLLGSLADSWNNITYMLLVAPLLLLTEKNKKVIYILSAILCLLLIISLKRIAILGLFFGYSIYIFRSGQIFKSAVVLTILGLFFFLAFPLIESTFNTRLEARGSKLSGGSAIQIIEQEGRYFETLAVLEEVISLENPIKILFGFQPFYSVGNYGNGAFGERQLHIDYNLIINTIGFIGMFLYLRIFYKIHVWHTGIKKQIKMTKSNKILVSVFYMLFFTQFITSFGGQMYAFTFRALIFLYLGAILGVLNNQIINRNKVYNESINCL